MNIVVHRQNLARLPQMIALAEELQVGKLEVATSNIRMGLRESQQAFADAEQVREDIAIVDPRGNGSRIR